MDIDVVPIGEVNVVSRMHELESEGQYPIIGTEGYNGGVVLTEVRDGTLIAQLHLLSRAGGAKSLRELRKALGRSDQQMEDADERLSMDQFTSLLPPWVSLHEKVTLGSVGLSPQDLFAACRKSLETRTRAAGPALFTFEGLDGLKFRTYTAEVRRGLRIELVEDNGDRHCLWFGPSATEKGVIRWLVDSPTEESAAQLMALKRALEKDLIQGQAS